MSRSRKHAVIGAIARARRQAGRVGRRFLYIYIYTHTHTRTRTHTHTHTHTCLLYTYDAADDLPRVDTGDTCSNKKKHTEPHNTHTN